MRRKSTENEKVLTMKDSAKITVCILSKVAMRGYLGSTRVMSFAKHKMTKVNMQNLSRGLLKPGYLVSE